MDNKFDNFEYSYYSIIVAVLVCSKYQNSNNRYSGYRAHSYCVCTTQKGVRYDQEKTKQTN